MTASPGLSIAVETPDQPAARAMLEASDAYMATLYPPSSNYLLGIDALTAANVRFLIARRDGVGVGCGAVILADDGSAELKRMWVDPAARRRRVGHRILARLEEIARQAGVHVLRLETGIAQPEALRLYRQAGFREIPAFGAYRPDPLSVFMEKRLE